MYLFQWNFKTVLSLIHNFVHNWSTDDCIQFIFTISLTLTFEIDFEQQKKKGTHTVMTMTLLIKCLSCQKL